MTRYYIDTEFVEYNHVLELISIGIVCEDGRELYMESSEFNSRLASQWVRENVLPHLKGGENRWRLDSIAVTLRDFFDIEEYGKPEIYGWCCAYDFVAFCQLWGTMMDLPAGYPHYFRELQRELDLCNITDDELPQQESGLHNSLEDARHIKKLWNIIFPSLEL